MTWSALSTVDALFAAPLDRTAEMALPWPDALDGPATTVASLPVPNSCASETIAWLAGSELPAAGALEGVTMTASVAPWAGWPVTVMNWPAE